jgi:K+-transporting ATPase A subunit
MKALAKYPLIIFLMTLSSVAFGQDAEMADTFRADGKIYVVVAVVLIVLAGLITYLFLLDRKMSKLEKMIENKKQTKR